MLIGEQDLVLEYGDVHGVGVGEGFGDFAHRLERHDEPGHAFRRCERVEVRQRELTAIGCNHLRPIFKEVEIEAVQEIPDFFSGCRKFGFREHAAQGSAINVQCLTVNGRQLRELLIRQPDDFVNAVAALQLHPVIRSSREADILGRQFFDDVCQFFSRNGYRAFFLDVPFHFDADAHLEVCRDTFNVPRLGTDEDV